MWLSYCQKRQHADMLFATRWASGHTESHPAFRELLVLVTAIGLCSAIAGCSRQVANWSSACKFAQPHCITSNILLYSLWHNGHTVLSCTARLVLRLGTGC